MGTKKTTSKKQIAANRKNAKKGGIKTVEGAKKSRFNAKKHGVLTHLLLESEAVEHEKFRQMLEDEFKPANAMEAVLVDLIASYQLRLIRLAQWEEGVTTETPMEPAAEMIDGYYTLKPLDEPLKATGKPHLKYFGGLDFEDLEKCQRYGTTLENRMYKALNQLERLQRMRIGENIQAPQIVHFEGQEAD